MEFFASDVLDELAPSVEVPSGWLDAEKRVIRFDALLSCPRVRANLAFHEAWRVATGAAPTRFDALDFATRKDNDALLRCLSEVTPLVLFGDAQPRAQKALAEYARCTSLFETDTYAVRTALLRKLVDRHCAPGKDVDARVAELGQMNLVAAYANVCCRGGGLEAYEAWAWAGAGAEDTPPAGQPATPAEAYARAGRACERLRLMTRCSVTGHAVQLAAGFQGSVTCAEAMRASLFRNRYLWRCDSNGAIITGTDAVKITPDAPFPFRVTEVPAACLLHALGQQRMYSTVVDATNDGSAAPANGNGNGMRVVRAFTPEQAQRLEASRTAEALLVGGPVPSAERWAQAPGEYWIPDLRAGSCSWAPAAPCWSDALTRAMWEAQLGPASPGLFAYHQFLARYSAIRGLNVRRFDCCAGGGRDPEAVGEVALIDTRSNVASVLSLFITLDNLRSRAWGVTVFCTAANSGFMQRCVLPHVPNARIEVLPELGKPEGRFDIETYNRLFKTVEFWERFSSCKRVLFVQDDGLLMRPGLEDDAEIMAQAYVGAPWVRGTNLELDGIVGAANMVGNGGLSLRDPVVMAAICRDASKEGSLDSVRLFNQRLQPEP